MLQPYCYNGSPADRMEYYLFGSILELAMGLNVKDLSFLQCTDYFYFKKIPVYCVNLVI